MERGFGGVYLLLLLGLIILAAAGGVFYWSQTSHNQPVLQVRALAKPTPLPTPTPSPWKIYANAKYNFQLTYPRLGVIHEQDDYYEGDCGRAIKEEKTAIGWTITFDNFFEMQILPWEGSIDDYLISKGAKNQYDVGNLPGSGADEAVKVIGLRKGAEYAVGYPPLVYISHIYKKGSFLFTIKTPPTHENPGGCVNPNLVDPVKYEKYKNQGWDFAKSLKFTATR